MPVPTIPYKFIVEYEGTFDQDVSNYKIVKLEKPIWRSGRRVFKYQIIRTADNSTVFLFQDLETAETTLEKLGS